jgi:hypothetical protein
MTLRPDYFDSLGRKYEHKQSPLQPVEYLEVRQPPAGTFSATVNREVEHLSDQARRQLRQPSQSNNVQFAQDNTKQEVKLMNGMYQPPPE